VKIKLSGVAETLLPPLWGRAQLSKEYGSLFYDEKAIELAEKIDYDLSTSDVPLMGIVFNVFRKLNLLGPFTLRVKQFDDKIKAYITEHPRASIVNIGAGLDTTFYRVDNGLIHWYDLDLPAVIDIRRQLLTEPDRVTYIAKSLFDPSWCTDINTEDGVFMIAEAVLLIFEESEIKQFFSMLADNFPDGEIVFDAPSKPLFTLLGSDLEALFEVFPQEQRDAIQAALVDEIKNWLERAPQGQKDIGFDIVATLIKWTLEDANEITKWDPRITVLDQFPMFKNILRDSLSADMRRFMDYSDKIRIFNIFHLRV